MRYGKTSRIMNGIYQVSNLGRIKSLHKKNSDNFIMKQSIKRTGYYSIRLKKNGMAKDFLVHRLVAKAFISNPNELPCINHKDENKKNNKVDNLEWCTHAYNNVYGDRLQKVSNTNKLRREVFQYDLKGNFINEYKSVTEAGKKNNIPISDVSSCCRGKYKRANIYIFKFKDEVIKNDKTC